MSFSNTHHHHHSHHSANHHWHQGSALAVVIRDSGAKLE